MKGLKRCLHILKTVLHSIQYIISFLLFKAKKRISVAIVPVAPVAQRYHVTSDTLGREFDPGKRDFSH